MSRIKLGVRSWSFRMYLPDGGMTVEQFMRTAAEMGLEGVEILARHFPDMEEETAKRYQRYARHLGIRIEAYALENDYAFLGCRRSPGRIGKHLSLDPAGCGIRSPLSQDFYGRYGSPRHRMKSSAAG